MKKQSGLAPDKGTLGCSRMTPRVSVIIATYNRAHLLKTAVDSVLAQTFRDIELIIADDGSTDDTAALVSSYNSDHSSRGIDIVYFYQENQGKSVALNEAIAKARGEWIAFLDSDDYWLEEKLDQQFRALEQYGDKCGACFTDGQFINNPHMDTTSFRFFEQHHSVPMGALTNSAKTFAKTPAGVSVVTLLCRTDLVRKVGGFDPALRFTEDYDFIFRLATITEYCFVNRCLVVIDRTPAASRHSGASAIWDDLEFRLRTEQRRYEKWLEISADLEPEIGQIVRERLRDVHSSWANWHLLNREYDRAIDQLKTATSYSFAPAVIAKLLLVHGFPETARGIIARRGVFKEEVF
jgi:glycosyltransferase involved in cell wall biosynthesis